MKNHKKNDLNTPVRFYKETGLSDKPHLGDEFDLKTFHSAVLDHGEPPLFIVEELVDRMIADRR